MCIVEEKSFIRPDGVQEVRTTERRCHHALGNDLCEYVDYRTAATARISKIRPSSSSSRPSSVEVYATGSDGRQRRYLEFRPRSSKRSSASSSKSNAMDSTVSSRKHRKTPPRAPSPPPMLSHNASVQKQYEEVNRVLYSDDTAIYDRPPSFEMYLAEGLNEHQPPARRSSISSISAEIDEPAQPRHSAARNSQPSSIVVDSGSSVAGRSAAPGLSNLPRFSHSRQDSENELPFQDSKRGPPSKVDSGIVDDETLYRRRPSENERQSKTASDRLSVSERQSQQAIDDEQAEKERSRLAESRRQQQQAIDDDQAEKERIRLFASAQRQQQSIDEEQAERERARLAASQRRHKQAQDDEQARIFRDNVAATESRQRVRAAREAEAAAQRHAEDIRREEEEREAQRRASEEARRERHRRRAASALERPEIDADVQRSVDAEFDRLLRKKDEDDAIRRAVEEAEYKAQFPGRGPTPVSAREYTPTKLSYVSSSMRYPSGVAVHNYTPASVPQFIAVPSASRERGEASEEERHLRRRQEKDSIDVAMDAMEARMRSAFGRTESVRDQDRRRRYEARQFYR